MIGIPSEIDPTEKIIRNIFHPFGIDSKGKITDPCITPPINSNELSVLRLDYTSKSICITHAKTQERQGKVFKGFIKFQASDITEVGLNIESTPLKDLPFHADIKYDHIFTKGVTVPTDIKK